MSLELNPKIFRGFSIRGVVGQELDAQRMTAIGRGVGTWFLNRGGNLLVCGYDVRESSPMLHQALIAGLLETGMDVIDVGRVPTPVLNFATDAYQAAGGVMVTASHNPAEYNGLKIRAERTVHGEDLVQIYNLVVGGQFLAGRGNLYQVDPLPSYLEAVVERVRLERTLHVVVDGSNGMNGQVVSPLLRRLGCQVTKVFCDPDGRFPNRDPDPTAPGATQTLASQVIQQQAQLGFAFDGDGDRVILVDDIGRTILGDLMLMLLARDFLGRQPGAKVVYEALCSQAVPDDIRAHGGKPIPAPSGYAFVHDQMLANNARLGGEMSGHFFILDDQFKFDDAILASLYFAGLAAAQECPLSSLVDALPRYFSSREVRLPCPDSQKGQIVKAVEAHYASDYPVDRLDGVRVLFDDGWAMVRQSNTQPALSLRFETKTSAERLWEIANDVLQFVAEEFKRRGIEFPLDISKSGEYIS